MKFTRRMAQPCDRRNHRGGRPGYIFLPFGNLAIKKSIEPRHFPKLHPQIDVSKLPGAFQSNSFDAYRKNFVRPTADQIGPADRFSSPTAGPSLSPARSLRKPAFPDTPRFPGELWILRAQTSPTSNRLSLFAGSVADTCQQKTISIIDGQGPKFPLHSSFRKKEQTEKRRGSIR